MIPTIERIHANKPAFALVAMLSVTGLIAPAFPLGISQTNVSSGNLQFNDVNCGSIFGIPVLPIDPSGTTVSQLNLVGGNAQVSTLC